ncbi:DNA-binding protein [Bacillus pumilus]|nr:DNA-binding protein [Bacillus pumilus]
MNEFHFKDIAELKTFMDEAVVNSSEAIKILGCTRQNLKQLVDHKSLTPIKITNRERLFLKADVITYKNKKMKTLKK